MPPRVVVVVAGMADAMAAVRWRGTLDRVRGPRLGGVRVGVHSGRRGFFSDRPSTTVSAARSKGFASKRAGAFERSMATVSPDAPARRYEAVVVGAGPAGLTCLGNLLDRKLGPILWVDEGGFDGGRINRLYREVPSNTKVRLFVDFATAVAPFRRIVSGAASRSRWDEPSESDGVVLGKGDKLQDLRSLDQDKGCRLSHAADMILMLTEGLKRTAGVVAQSGRVVEAVLDEGTAQWTVRLDTPDDPSGGNVSTATTPRLIMCTGASPINAPLPVSIPGIRQMDLDTALSPTRLRQALAPDGPSTDTQTVAVVGASHSAILVLMNLSLLASTSHPGLRIRWFTRHPLRYAEYMDGWILRDNTGLKGEAAAWAKANLEPEVFPQSDTSNFLTPISYDKGAEKETFEQHLPGCDYHVQAIGYEADALPTLRTAEGESIAPVFDHHTGAFTYGQDGRRCPGLYGAGIAFPERVTDPRGNVEMAVGFFKFMKFVKRVAPEWN